MVLADRVGRDGVDGHVHPEVRLPLALQELGHARVGSARVGRVGEVLGQLARWVVLLQQLPGHGRVEFRERVTVRSAVADQAAG